MTRITLAHIPVVGAIAFTMYANGAFAFSQVSDPQHQAAAVALAVIIDVAKATFLPASARMRVQGKWLGAMLLFLLFWPALIYSTFAGYSYLATTRAVVAVSSQAAAAERQRTQAEYDRLIADLATAKASPEWKASAACARPRNRRERAFCETIAETQAKLDAAATRLTTLPAVPVSPEIAGLATVTGLRSEQLTFWVAFFPAVLVELLAGFGLYALRPRIPPEALQSRAGATTSLGQPQAPSAIKKPPTAPATRLESKPAPKALVWKVTP